MLRDSSKRDAASISLLYLCCCLLLTAAAGDNKARIYEDAPAGTPLTFDKDLYEQLLLYRSCFGQLQQDESPEANLIEFDSERWELMLTAQLNLPVGTTFRVVVRLLCADNLVKSFDIYVSVTRRNTFAPEFTQQIYDFYVPTSALVGAEVARLYARDKDSIVYNAHFSMDLFSQSGADRMFKLFPNGSIVLQHRNLSGFPVYERIKLTAVACDFGSPKLCTDVAITITPVTVMAPRNVQVNVATEEYQIFEWSPPLYGQATSYRIVIGILQKDENFVTTKMNSTEMGSVKRLMMQTRLNSLTNYTLCIYSADAKGETPSEKLHFQAIPNTLNCSGECDVGGRPACYYSTPGTLEPQQYWDISGPRCVCYDGYFGHKCSHIDSCPQQTISETIGRMVWNETTVNGTARIACPYGPAGYTLHRRCSWDRDEERPVWEKPLAIDVEGCRKKNTLLSHMGVLNNYVDRAKSILAIETLIEFLEPMLGSAAIDMDIGRHMINMIDNAMRRNWSELAGNSSTVLARVPALMITYASLLEEESVTGRVHTLSSKGDGMHIAATHWDDPVGNRTLFLGPDCFVVLPPATAYSRDKYPQNFFGIWMRNGTFYPVDDTSVPVLEMALKHSSRTPLSQPIIFGLKVGQMERNATCVSFNKNAQKWSQEGMRTVTQNDSDGFTVCETFHLSSFTIVPEEDPLSKPGRMLLESEFHEWLSFLSSIFVEFCCFALLLCGAISNICCRQPFQSTSIVLLFIVLLLNAAFAIGSIWSSLLEEERPCWALASFMRFAVVAAVMLLSVSAAALHSQVGRVRLMSRSLATGPSAFKYSLFSSGCYNAVAIALSAALAAASILLKESSFSPASHKECLPTTNSTSIFTSLFIGPILITALVAFLLLFDTMKQSFEIRRKLRSQSIGQNLIEPGVFRRPALYALAATAAFVVAWLSSVSQSFGFSRPPEFLFYGGQTLFAICLVLFVCTTERISRLKDQINCQWQQQSGRNSVTNSLDRKRESSGRKNNDNSSRDSPIRLRTPTALGEASESTLSNSTTKEPLLNEHNSDLPDAATNNNINNNNNNSRFVPIVSVV